LSAGKTVLVAAHGNSLRALVKHLDGISDADITGLNIPAGIPLHYELTEDFTPVRPGGTYLDPAAAEAAIGQVANQGRCPLAAAQRWGRRRFGTRSRRAATPPSRRRRRLPASARAAGRSP